MDGVLNLLEQNDIRAEIQDKRVTGCKVAVRFTGALRKDQKAAVKAILKYETGVLCAPAAFGKTVTAAALIVRRKVSTLILVHRTVLLRQWQERLTTFLELPKRTLGLIGGGKKKPTGKLPRPTGGMAAKPAGAKDAAGVRHPGCVSHSC